MEKREQRLSLKTKLACKLKLKGFERGALQTFSKRGLNHAFTVHIYILLNKTNACHEI